MTTLEQFVSPALTRALGWTLLHSLWQGALVAAVLAGALLLLRRQRAELRYAASAGALALIVALAGLTFGLYFNASPVDKLPSSMAVLQNPSASSRQQLQAPATKAATATEATRASVAVASLATLMPAVAAGAVASPAVLATASSVLAASLRYFDNHLPLLVLLWLLGLLAMSLRLLGGLLYVQRLRRYRVRPLPAVWQQRLASLTARAGVHRPVALLESALVRVPLVVGHLRPVILLPLGTVAGLSPAYLEAILAHELAHVLRRDYLVNLLQTVAEAVFFYHPAVWFVAGCVRTERENCCDDAATALVGGDPLRLARALTALAEWSQSATVAPAPRLALAAIGRRGALLSRVRRLVTRRPAAPTLAEGIMAGALVLGGLALLGSSVALAGPLTQAVLPTANRLGRAIGAASGRPAAAGRRSAPNLGQPALVIDGVRDLTLLPGGQAQATLNGTTMAFDTLLNPVLMRRGRRQGAPGTVVITRDKKGRLTSLLVNGQPVPVPTSKPTKEERRTGQQVTVVPVPDSRRPAVPGTPELEQASRELDQAGRALDSHGRDLDRAGRELDKAGRKLDKLGRKMDQAAEKLDRKSEGTYAYDYNESRRAPNRNSNSKIHIDIDDAALDQLVNNALKLGNLGLNIGLRAAGQGLEEARRSLEETLRDPTLSSEARRATREALAELRQEQGRQQPRRNPDPGNRTQEAQRRRQELEERIRVSQRELSDLEQERTQANQDRSQAERDRLQTREDRMREESDRRQERADRNQERADRDRDRHDALVREMQKDGLIKDPDHYQVQLTARSLVINGKEQSPKILQKYLKLYEASTGRKLGATNAMMITRNSDSSTFISNGAPAPPRPPRVPRGPAALPPPPPMSPAALPVPPAPPRLDTGDLREELRKDGVLQADEKNLQFQLNASGLTVNGKKQSDELAAKYRKLTGHTDGKNFNVMISTQEE